VQIIYCWIRNKSYCTAKLYTSSPFTGNLILTWPYICRVRIRTTHGMLEKAPPAYPIHQDEQHLIRYCCKLYSA